jgi:putative ABC transport system permease protein
MDLLRLVTRNLLRHPLRTLLTTGSLVVAFFLLCTLRSLVTTLEAGTSAAASNRLWVQSAVSLFVDMPLSYPERIAQVEGVEEVCKWQWFGGYYQDESNFFAQFAVDPQELLDCYPEVVIVEGSAEAFLTRRDSCIVGDSLASQYGWKVGDRVPIIGALFPHPDGADRAWEFEVAGIYDPTTRNIDDRTLFFHWELFEETLERSPTGLSGVGAIVLRTASDADQTRIMREVDALYENGPQRVQTTTEAEFQAQFISMFGNVPFFVSAIGGGVFAAILLACVNTMLMAAREQRRDIGILKALGFRDSTVATVLLAQSLSLCTLGGLAGVGLALGTEQAIGTAMGAFFPGYAIEQQTIIAALVLVVVVGLAAGLAPAWTARRSRVIDTLAAHD